MGSDNFCGVMGTVRECKHSDTRQVGGGGDGTGRLGFGQVSEEQSEDTRKMPT